MNRRLVIIAAALLLAGGAAAYVLLRPHGKKAPVHHAINKHGSDVHVDGFNRAAAPIDALYTAEEGKTPCETLYNAIQAERATAKARGKSEVFYFVAEHDDFFAHCNALPENAKPCLTPRYSALHREDCKKLRPPDAVLDAMYKTRVPEDTVQERPEPIDPGQTAPPPAPNQSE